MNNKRIISLLIALTILCILIVGCSESNEVSVSDKDVQKEQVNNDVEEQDNDEVKVSAEKTFVRGETVFEKPDIDYPKKTVTVVCPYSPGGGTDLLSRVFAEYATKKTGIPFIVTNVTGGGASNGSNYVLDSDPDGYTILFSHNVVLVNRYISKVTDYDHNSFEMGPMVSEDLASGFFSRADAPFDNFAEMVEFSEENPGEVIVGVETGAFSYAMVSDLMNQVGVEWKLVDAGGNGPKISAMLGGHIDVMPNQYGTTKSYIKSGDFKCLGFSGHERAVLYPDVSTFEEQGVDAYHPGYTFAIYLPKNTDPEIVSFYDWLIYEMQSDADAIEKCENIGNTLTNWLPSYEAQKYWDEMSVTYKAIGDSMQ